MNRCPDCNKKMFKSFVLQQDDRRKTHERETYECVSCRLTVTISRVTDPKRGADVELLGEGSLDYDLGRPEADFSPGKIKRNFRSRPRAS